MGGGWRLTPEASILFSFGTDFTWRVKAGHQIETGRRRSAAGPHTSRDSFYRTARDRRQARPGVTEIPLKLLPRVCPFCGNRSIVGHGRRLKQAHDRWHKQIGIRRGLCRPCQKTFTVLPDWSPPSGHYSLQCRQEAWELLHRPDSNWERCVPDVADATRSPEPSTVWGTGNGLAGRSHLRCCVVSVLTPFHFSFPLALSFVTSQAVTCVGE
jgi:hypothetical protein